jgi:SAM-dependent methyltransferase
MTDFADRITGHYERHATAWDTDRRKSGWNDKRWHDRFIEVLPKRAKILDLGCGGGSPVAVDLVAHALGVTGVDSSPTLISLCRNRLPEQEWIVADMRSLSLGRTFEGLLAWDSFFHLKPNDQRSMFAVFASHTARDEYEELLTRSGFDLVDHTVDDPQAGGRTVWLARKAGAR